MNSTEGDEVSLKKITQNGMELFKSIENGTEATNSPEVQLKIKQCIRKFEEATNLVSATGIFSKNESVEELTTDSLQYLLLPAMLGMLTLKLSNQPRMEIINVADIYFRDFLQRCNDYGVSDLKIPGHISEEKNKSLETTSEVNKLVSMVSTRDAKIRKYKEQKELKEKLALLKRATETESTDEATSREYFITLLQDYANQCLDELESTEAERPILEYMAANKDASQRPTPKHKSQPLRPIIITRDAVQKAVYGMGYPSMPTYTVEEFYEKRALEGTMPSASNIPHQTVVNTEEQDNEDADVEKENKEEADDEEELQRARAMDEYKDEHRRGWGNRHNRS